MASLMVATRVAFARHRVRDVVDGAHRVSGVLRWATPFRTRGDTRDRAQALAHTWSGRIPGCSCLHRAVSTQLWLAAVGVESRVVLGLRKRETIEGHAWLELASPPQTLFDDDEDGYPVLL